LDKTKSEILLGTLSRNELKSFNDYISYALKNKSCDVKNFWSLIYSAESGNLNKIPKESVSRKTLSDFNKQIEKYFILKNLESDDLDNAIYLTRELRKRNIEKYFEQLITEINNLRHLKLGKGFQNTLSLLKLNYEEYFLYNSRNDNTNLNRISKERIELSELIAAHSKLFEYINGIFLSNEYKFKESGLLKIKDVVEFVEKNKIYFKKSYPSVWTLYLIYKAINDSGNYKIVRLVILYFTNNEKSFTEEFLQFGYESILKLIFKELNSGNSRAFEDLCSILLNMENKGIINQIHNIPPNIFAVFVIVAISSDNMELAEKLVTVYNNKIVSSLREQVLNVCRAMIELPKGNYNTVKKLLADEKPRDSMLYIFCKITLIKTYYENSEFRNIYPLTDNLKHFLKRRNDTSDINASVNKFLNYTSRLAQVKKNKGKGLEYVEVSFSKEKYFFQKSWIVEKINQLSAKI
jgi:hypothetical protein